MHNARVRRGLSLAAALTALGLAGAGCAGGGPDRPPPHAAAAPDLTTATTVRVAAAGDIARTETSARGTARLIRSLGPDAVLTLGDNAYPTGSFQQFQQYYDPTWGTFRAITHPAPGNHDYLTTGAAGYFRYFRDEVGDRPYYAWNAGTWRMYSLNCEIACGRGSRQLAWLEHDLDRIGSRPALGYVHEPLFTCSTGHDPSTLARPIWRALDRASGRILLTGHNHAYERFARQHADGSLSRRGVREFVVGTGGAERYALLRSCRHRLAAVDDSAGVLLLRLSADGYRWRFITTRGVVRDRGATSFG
jgi:acid phosphatase type 7